MRQRRENTPTADVPATSGPGRVFIQLGARPDERGQFVHPGARASYSGDVRARLAVDAQEILARYPSPRSALLPLLHLVQAEDGYITPAGIEFCADHVGITDAEVVAVATFYSMYRRASTGDYLVGVCTNTLCAIMGGDAILAAVEEHLDARHGETTADGRITIEHIECNAACDFAPVMMVNWEFFDNQTPESARSLVDALRAGEPVTPSRGAPLCTFRETARILAGFPDERPDVEAGSSGGAATIAGLRVARELDMRAPDPPDRRARSEPQVETTEPAAVESLKEAPAPAPSEAVPPKPAKPETDPVARHDTPADHGRKGD